MHFIIVYDDSGILHHVNAAFILDVRPRPRTELGSVIRFSNGTSMNVMDGENAVMQQIPDGR